MNSLECKVSEGQHVLVLWSGNLSSETIEGTVTKMQQKVGENGRIALENAERLGASNRIPSSFDVVLSGLLFPSTLVHTMDLLADIAKNLKPHGKLILQEPAGTGKTLRSPDKIKKELRFSGFVQISEVAQLPLNETETQDLMKILDINHSEDAVSYIEVSASKPGYEVGSSTQLPLSFNKKVENKAAAQIWTLSANDINDEEVDLLDSDTLLDAEDLIKPDPASLKSDCGGSKAGKKKACKNCSCGLADELDEEANGGERKPRKDFTSSCGSCYLGDAFRCSSCPYLGMPAFKPGEKIQLTDRQLKPDM